LQSVVIHFLVLLSIFSSSLVAADEDRHALIIGNSEYQNAIALNNPINDATDIADALDQLNFKTVLVENTSLQAIEVAVNDFIQTLKRTGGVGLFYYAGHGMQVNGENYLLPVETRSDKNIKSQGYNVSLLLDGFRNTPTSTNIIILDACRDNPFLSGSGNGGRSVSNASRALVNKNPGRPTTTGLSKLSAPPDTLIAFSTAPGKTANDGNGRNSPYTKELIEAIKRQGLSIDKVFRTIRENVVDTTDGQQIPWESSSLINNFYFNPRKSLPMGF